MMKPKIEPQDYRYWVYELGCLKDCFTRPASISEVQEQLDEIRGYIWYAVGEDFWNQP